MATTHPDVFEPGDLASIASAYDAVLGEVAEIGDGLLHLPARDLRRKVASCVLFAARSGERDPEALKRMALEAVTRPLRQAG